MPRYIDAEKLKLVLSDNGLVRSDLIALRHIDAMPTADVVEVKHGKWVCMSDADGYYYCCSVCGEHLERIQTRPCTAKNPYPDLFSCSKTKFCPNCGAVMDE